MWENFNNAGERWFPRTPCCGDRGWPANTGCLIEIRGRQIGNGFRRGIAGQRPAFFSDL